MLGDADGAVEAFLRRDAAEECEVRRLDRLGHQQRCWQAVMNGAHPICLRQRPSLRIGDRNHRYRGKCVEHRLMLRQIEPAVQRGRKRRRLTREQGERIIIEMAMQKIEIGRRAKNPLEHHHVQRIGIAHRTVKPQRPGPDGFEPGRSHRIPAGEQRHLVAERDQFFRQPGHHALGAAIQLRRDSFGQRRNLCDMHRRTLEFFDEFSPADTDNVGDRKNIGLWKELNFAAQMELFARWSVFTKAPKISRVPAAAVRMRFSER